MEKTTSQPKKKEKKKEKEKKHVESRKKGESWSTYKRKTEKEKGGEKEREEYRKILKSSAWHSDSFVWSTLRCNRRIRNDVLAGRQSFSTPLSVGGPSRRDEWYAGTVGPLSAAGSVVGARKRVRWWG